MIVEVWKPLLYKDVRIGYYEISSLGRIRLKSSRKILKTFISNRNYVRIGLSSQGSSKRKNYSVHRLVALHFIPRIPNKNHVNHIDGCALNNTASNLEWCDQSENNIHAYDNNLAYTKGENHHFSKYSDKMVHDICGLLEKGIETFDIIVKLDLVDMELYSRGSVEYQRIRNIIKALRRKKFRRDIVSQYNY